MFLSHIFVRLVGMRQESFITNFPAGFSIGSIPVCPATVLAPMAGVTDTVFRRLIRNQGGCGLLMTEFTSSHGVVSTRVKEKGPTAISAIFISSRKSIPSPVSCSVLTRTCFREAANHL